MFLALLSRTRNGQACHFFFFFSPPPSLVLLDHTGWSCIPLCLVRYAIGLSNLGRVFVSFFFFFSLNIVFIGQLFWMAEGGFRNGAEVLLHSTFAAGAGHWSLLLD